MSAKRFTVPVLMLLLLAVLLQHSTLASATAFERVLDPVTGDYTTREYNTHAEVVQEAERRGMSVNKFLNRAALNVQAIPFSCAVRNETQTIYFHCTEKTADNLCKGRSWYIFKDNAITFLNGNTGVDVCTHTTCKDMVCHRDDNKSAIMQTFSKSEMTPEGCACLDPATGNNSWDGMYYTEASADYPWDDDVNCPNVACLNASFPEGGTVVYENAACMCWYPRGIQHVIRHMYPGTVTATTRTPTQDPTGTPDPAETDSPGPAIPTISPTVGPSNEDLSAVNATPLLCPNVPQGLTDALYLANIDKFCCTIYFNVNYNWTACGATVFQSMPEGWAYCRSTIPSFGFCCEVEHMHYQTFVYRGDKCFPPPRTDLYS